MMMMLGKAARRSSVLRAFLTRPLSNPSATAIAIPSCFIPEVAVPIVIPSRFSLFRFYKCPRYPWCSQTFRKKETMVKHIQSKICIPKAEKEKEAADALKKKEKEAADALKKKEKEEVDLNGHQVVKLLAYINEKDLFAEFYRNVLARRILFDKTVNDDREKSILSQLKQQCGGHFTSKMEGMESPSIDLTVTTGFWPSYKSFDLNLPADMVMECVEQLSRMFKASVLLLFNSSDRLSYSEMSTQLNMTDDDIVRLLHSLSCAKYKILLKEPNTKTISQTDTFELNSKFTDTIRRIEIPLPPVDEKKKVIEDVDKDRRYAIDASIVRIMKSRKFLGHQQLVMECVEQLSRMFKADFKVLRKRMEDLITRDYLERDKDNPNLFRYLA